MVAMLAVEIASIREVPNYEERSSGYLRLCYAEQLDPFKHADETSPNPPIFSDGLQLFFAEVEELSLKFEQNSSGHSKETASWTCLDSPLGQPI